jgi:predicted HTH transcriptional regulator
VNIIPTAVLISIVWGVIFFPIFEVVYMHRSYSKSGSPIFVAVYDDRIDVTSWGMLPYGLTVEGVMSGHSNPRNHIIAKFFKEANLTEGWGRGIRKVVFIMQRVQSQAACVPIDRRHHRGHEI